MRSLLLIFVGLTFLWTGVSEAKLRGEKRTFTITGYYSPLPNQSFYVTGSYETDIRLNGRGIAAMDGTPVYPGMIAAPRSYSFGTQICVPSLGCGKVHDRGGAIVEKGGRSIAKHDRLDIWMGYGEEGLRRALAWGVQHLECDMYGANSPIKIGMDFDIPPMLHEVLDLPGRRSFIKNLSFGMRGDSVRTLQEALQYLDLYHGALHGRFNAEVKDSVFEFQKRKFIVGSENDLGAGRFGPKTRGALTSAVYGREVQEKILQAWEKFHFEENLIKGHRNQAVLKLQQILVQHEFMDVSPTGYFGPKTQKALVAFQKHHGIIRGEWSAGAGKVGPLTRAKLNSILAQEKEEIVTEKEQIMAYQKALSKLYRLAGKEHNLNNNFVQR